jgi:glutaredoxin|uniref:glutaredoxin family protein n=1 Tax=Candidatus Planktophila sp. TaxID=2175601 RepID=UPI00404B339A
MTRVSVYSRHGCHLCEVAVETLAPLSKELDFEIEIIYIEENQELINLYSDQIPVIHIDGKHHDFYKVDPVRFTSSLEKHRQHQ